MSSLLGFAALRRSTMVVPGGKRWMPVAAGNVPWLTPGASHEIQCRPFASGKSKKPPTFRRPNKAPVIKKRKKTPKPMEIDEVDYDRIFDMQRDTAAFGDELASTVRQTQSDFYQKKGNWDTVDEFLRGMDYLTAADGSTEDLAGERRALSFESRTEEQKQTFVDEIEERIERQRIQDLGLEPWEDPFEGVDEDDIGNVDDKLKVAPNQLVFGEWGELLIRVDRNIKLWRGGRIPSYRALVIGGNLNGCAGFGTGKAPGPREAVLAASRKCKRNIFFASRYQTNALTHDLVGRSNSCKVLIRATNRGLRGNPLSCEILKYFGITHASCKAVHGQRSQFNVVRATFKAILTHESMEDISRKRGRRILSIDHGRRLGI